MSFSTDDFQIKKEKHFQILLRIFPRVSAAAEKLWSQQNVKDVEEAARRLEEHYCRMNMRGIPAQPPNGPGFCL